MAWMSNATLYHPFRVALICVLIGVGGGLALELYGFDGFFGRFGSLTVALGVFAFGAVASDLLIRGQGAYITDENGYLPYPYDPKSLGAVLGMQTVIVIIGTIQWGFGDLIGDYQC